VKAERRRAFIDAWVVAAVCAAHVAVASHGADPLTKLQLEAMIREERKNASIVFDIMTEIEKDEVFIP
jgi:hypothetical protein